MKIVLAPDKFKGSLTGIQFCNVVENGIKEVFPEAEIIKLPLADGGDGTIEVVNFYLNGDIKNIAVSNPFFHPITASYLYAENSQTAFIEMAEASGLKLLSQEKYDCKNASTLGTGELILDAINKRAKTIILGIGGSATNDCGIGMATALGYRFLDKNNQEVRPIGTNLSKIVSIDLSKVHAKLNEVKIKIACDVTNPLFGKNGAAYVYAAQKGASQDDIRMLDEGLEHFSEIINTVFNVDAQSVKGAGAAGGMGIASKIFLNGDLQPGIQLIKHLAQFDSKLEDVDWIITGEGKLDAQTISGKTIQGVIDSAKAKNIKVAAFCGTIDLDEIEIKDIGISYAASIMNNAVDFEDAINNTPKHLKKISVDFSNKIKKNRKTIFYQDSKE